MTITNNVGWYMDIAAQTAPDGVQVLAYTWGKDKVQARIRRPGQDWTLGARCPSRTFTAPSIPPC